MAGLKAENVVFLFGEKEKWMVKDNRRVVKRMKKQHPRRIVVPKEGHGITKPYLEKILEAIKESN